MSHELTLIRALESNTEKGHTNAILEWEAPKMSAKYNESPKKINEIE